MRGSLLQQIGGCLICLFCCGASVFAQPVDTLLPVNERGKWGFVTSKGILAFPFEYESALYWGAARFGKVKKNGQWNLLTRKGHLLKLPVEGIPEVFNDSILIIKTLSGEVLVSENGRRILPDSYAKIRPLENGYFAYYRNDSCGLGHIVKGVITAPLYSNIQQKGKDGFVVSSCKKNGWLNAKGEELLEPIYEFIQYGENGLLQIQLGEASLTGVYDYRQPQWLIECAWTELNDSNSTFLVMNDERGSFLYHRKTATWFPGVYQQIELRKDIARILCDTGQGIISNENQVLLAPIYSSIQKEHGAYIVQKDSVYKLFQLNGKSLNNESYKNIQSLSTPAWVVERTSDWAVIDSTGKMLLSNLHDPLVLGNKVKYYDGSSMLSFQVNEKGQITNRQSFDNVVKLKVNGYAESIEKPQTALAGPGKTDALARWFREDKSQKWGLILANGKTAIPPTYDYIISDQLYGLTYVYIKKARRELNLMGEECAFAAKAGLVDDQTGKEIIPPKYLDIFLTGGTDNPLYFGITEDFRYQQIIPNSKEKMPIYAWVDKVTHIPVRALAGNGLDRKTNASKERICSKNDMLNRINNPTFKLNYNNNTRRSVLQGLTSSLKKWVYIFPNTVKPIGYFSEAETFNYKTAIVRDYNSQLYGLLGKDGEFSVAKAYSNIERRQLGDKMVYLLTKADSSTCLLNNENDIITMNKNLNVVNYDNHITYVIQEFHAGYYDAYNRPVLFVDAEKTGELSEGFIAVCRKGKWTYYRENKTALNDEAYTKAFAFHHGKALIKERGKWYFLMMDGIKSDALPWKQMKPLSNGHFLVSNGKKWFVADEEGNALSEESGFEKASILKEAPMIAVSNGNKWGLFTNEGQAASAMHYSHIQYLGDDLYALYKGKRLYLKHGTTKEKKAKHIDFMGKTAEGKLPIRKKKGWAFADTSLKAIVPTLFTTLRTQHQGYSIASSNNHYCLVDSNGTIAFTTPNRLTGNFSDGYVLMFNSHTNSYSFVNTQGENRFGYSYEKAFPFENGKAWVKQNNFWGSIDNSGEWIDYPRYYDVKKLNASAYIAKAGALFGICDEVGRMLLDPSYDRIEMRDKQFIGGAKGASMVWKHISGEEIFNRIGQAALANTP